MHNKVFSASVRGGAKDSTAIESCPFFPRHLRQRCLAFRAHISVPYYAELTLLARELFAHRDRDVTYDVLVELGFAREAACFNLYEPCILYIGRA